MIDSPDYWRFVAALIFVLGLIFIIAWAVRRFGLAGVRPTPLGRRRRLAVIEALPLDARRRLILVRRDGVEHLLILGAQGETVVESRIHPPDGSFDASLAAAAGKDPSR